MAVSILIKRVIKEDKVDDFLAYYQSHRGSDHPGFIGEYLTRLDNTENLPPALKNFDIAASKGVTFINIVFFQNASDFEDHFQPKIMFDENYELENRQRIVLQVQENVSELTSEMMNI